MLSRTETRNALNPVPDEELVLTSLSGNREAFGQVVERYQRLLCSLAYAATGSLTESEDLAQDAFVEAWRGLHTLREPAKLRSWLCGILRFKISRHHRSAHTEPSRHAEDLEAAAEMPSPDHAAPDHAMDREEQAILWSALERVPARYREPLVLYYREHQSVGRVAESLELSEDAVKQRLSRGRQMLQERVLAMVEGALSRSTPGKVFTLGVLAALPDLALPAQAAGVGTAAAQGTLVAKSAGVAGWLASMSGIVSAVLTLRANLDQARTPRERRAVVRLTVAIFVGAWGLLGVMWLLRLGALRSPSQAWWLAAASQCVVMATVAGWPIALLRLLGRMRRLRSQERRRHPALFSDARDRVGSSVGEYRSARTFLGVPWVHVRYASAEEGQGPVFGWFAGGDRAIGLLVAWGAWAVGLVSVGALAVGLVSVGSLSFGVVSIGTVSVGAVAWGCMAVGLKAYAWLSALGWQTAAGSGFSIARIAADGPIPIAPHINDTVARQLLGVSLSAQTQMIVLAVISAITVVPVALYARTIRERLGSASPARGSHDPMP